jgi:AGCS family alanine or glycine:cation symporter
VLWVLAVLVGSVVTLKSVWLFADIANGLMAVPNLVSLIALSGVIVAETRTYLWTDNLDAEAPLPSAFEGRKNPGSVPTS